MDRIYYQAEQVVVCLGNPLSNSYLWIGVDEKTYAMLEQLGHKLWTGALQPWDRSERPDLEHPGIQDIESFINNCKSDNTDEVTCRSTMLAVDIYTNPY